MNGVRIVGSGLIGTSIALALTGRGVSVEMTDSDPTRAALAQDLVGKGTVKSVGLVILALPTSRLSSVISREFALNPRAIFIDVGSIKVKPVHEIDAIPGLSSRFCGTHPMAGREIGGPEGARADLLLGRPWIFTPGGDCDPDVLEGVLELIESLGAIPIQMAADEHDSAVALVSHLPQLASSLLAKQISSGPEAWLALAGQGVKDSTRIAASDPKLWREIIAMNREKLRPLLIKMSNDLSKLISEFDDDAAIEAFLHEGRMGRERIPGKHGGRPRDYTYLPIVIEDKSGQLAALFHECAQAQVNVEDLSIEHSPGQFTGLVTLALSAVDAEKLSAHLETQGWNVHSLR